MDDNGGIFSGRCRIFTGPLLERAGGGVISTALEPQKKNRFFLQSGSHCAAGMQIVRGFLFRPVLSSALLPAHMIYPWGSPAEIHCSKLQEASTTSPDIVFVTLCSPAPYSADVCLIFIVDCAMLLVHAVYDP